MDENGKITDDEICLPDDTLAILQQFLKDKEEREKLESEILNTGETKPDIDFEENWQLSQFWYSDETKKQLAGLCKKLALNNKEFRIGLLSSPSLYTYVKEMHENVKIFEFDERFSAYGSDFVHYDYTEGDDKTYLQPFHKYFDLIIADPPFLSEECIEKMSKIIGNLQKSDGKIVLCSGETVEPWAFKFMGLIKCNFQPKHNRNLGNEFVSFSNFNLDDYL